MTHRGPCQPRPFCDSARLGHLEDVHPDITLQPRRVWWLVKAVLEEQGCEALLGLGHVVLLPYEILPLQKLCPASRSITPQQDLCGGSMELVLTTG